MKNKKEDVVVCQNCGSLWECLPERGGVPRLLMCPLCADECREEEK
jgi:hypothetical protein